MNIKEFNKMRKRVREEVKKAGHRPTLIFIKDVDTERGMVEFFEVPMI